mmetsp:Transcript_26383/g.57856  ORF Transcript_26383/g.57856 Transcript_26383/m.57856 type:complete len:254 (+) Transcript_26383:130-891(+)
MGGVCSRLFSILRGYAPAATDPQSVRPLGQPSVEHATDIEMGTRRIATIAGQTSPQPLPTVEVTLSEEMSSPTAIIDPDDKRTISGHGLALSANAIPSDGASYWEWHVKSYIMNDSGKHDALMFGVSSKRNQAFYKILSKGDGSAASLKLATKDMRYVTASSCDIVGVAIDMSPTGDKGGGKPTVQLRLNGELMEEYHLGFVRGRVFPSIWLPPPDGTASAVLVGSEPDLAHPSPGPQYLPLGVDAAGGGTIV